MRKPLDEGSGDMEPFGVAVDRGQRAARWQDGWSPPSIFRRHPNPAPRCAGGRPDDLRFVEVGLGGEGVGVELVFRQLAQLDELALGRIDHDGCAAGVDLVARQVGQVVDHGLVHEAGAAVPVVLVQRVRHHRHVLELRQLDGPLAAQRIHVQILRPAPAPVQSHRPGRAAVDQVLDDGLDRRETGARGQEHHRLVAVVAHEEGAMRTLEAQDVALLHRAEHLVGEQAAGQGADVQRERFVSFRRGVHAVAAALAVAQHEFDILAGAVLQLFMGRQLQRDDDHVRRQLLDAAHARRHFLDREVAAAGHFARLDHQVAVRGGAAEQRVAQRLFLRRQRALLVRLVADRAGHDLALAGAAGAVLAAVGQADAGPHGRRQHGVVGVAIELMAAGLYSYVERHTIFQMKTTHRQKMNRPRLLIVGCGDVGMRLLPLLRTRFRIYAVTSQPGRCAELRAAGAVPLVADLDQPATLRRLAGLARHIIHLAPPQPDGALDRRTRALCAILPERARLVYVSTSGVYGDCGGALRRVDAERTLRRWAGNAGASVSILRVPGIYGADRLPLKRLREGTPALIEADDVYTNHIHADDLAAAIVRALWRGLPGRVYHAVDDSDMKMAAYFDAVADAFQLPRPPRLPRAALARVVTPAVLSFMSESRRLRNDRLTGELGLRLRYPTVAATLAACVKMVD